MSAIDFYRENLQHILDRVFTEQKDKLERMIAAAYRS